MLTIDIITKMAPKMVIYLPENSLPNISPSPKPPIIPTDNPILSITITPQIIVINHHFTNKSMVLKPTGVNVNFLLVTTYSNLVCLMDVREGMRRMEKKRP